MSLWNKTTQPVMPQEVSVPMPEQDITNGGEITSWAPKRHHNLHIGEAEDTVIRAAGVFKDLKEQLASQDAQIAERDIRIGILEGRIRDLELTNAQSCNNEIMANQVRDEALREMLFLRGKLSAVRGIVDDDEIPMPRKRARKAAGAENGAESTGVALATETPPGEAPKPEGTDGQAQEK